ncbi:MAG TPA: hypothetical protein VGV87_03445, partial [Blastocatellia bacterium]|nr:hypothetical protein [Blastocatellia bacterium]
SYLLGTAVLYTISILLVAILVFAAGELTALLFGIIISAVALFSAFPIILQWFLIRSSGLVIVSNRYRNEVRGLSAETKRLVIVGVIASVLGAVISGVFGFWQGLFLK